jgi:hypothetical protein
MPQCPSKRLHAKCGNGALGTSSCRKTADTKGNVQQRDPDYWTGKTYALPRDLLTGPAGSAILTRSISVIPANRSLSCALVLAEH